MPEDGDGNTAAAAGVVAAGDKRVAAIDRAKAMYIADTMLQAQQRWKQCIRYSNNSSSSDNRSGDVISSVRVGRRMSFAAAATCIFSSTSKPAAATVMTANSITGNDKQQPLQIAAAAAAGSWRRPKAIVFSQYQSDLQVGVVILYRRTINILLYTEYSI